MNNKNLIIVLALTLLIDGGLYFRASRVEQVAKDKILIPSPDNQFHYVPKWYTYRDGKYGFSVTYLDYQNVRAETEMNTSNSKIYPWANLKKYGMYFVSFADGDMWESVVWVFETDLPLKEFVSRKLEAEKKQNDEYNAKNSTGGYLVTVIDKETMVSGYHAVIYHGYIKGDEGHIAERNLLVKTPQGIFQFTTRVGEPYYNNYFIESVKFDK